MKIVTTICMVLLFFAVRSTGALRQLPAAEPQKTTTDVADTTSGAPAEISPGSQPAGTPQTTSPGTSTDAPVAIAPSVPVASTSTTSGTSTPTSSSGTMTGGTSAGTSGTGSGTGGSTGGTTTPTVTYKYKNGTYYAFGAYNTPGGIESINVSLTVSNDIIVDSAVTGNATTQPSKSYQLDFIASYKPYVIGKKLDQVYLTKVSSSSLTTIGFNNATDNVEVQAKI